jgi:methylglutaconyl-CoA hydratase
MAVLEFTTRGRIGILTMNREASANALSRELLEAYAQAGEAFEANGELRALVVTGAGKTFCAGADLKERRTMSKDDVRTVLLRYRSALGWLESSARPVVAAVNGPALGGGLELALLCDLRIAAPEAVLGLPETQLGIIPGAGGTQRLPRIVGAARAKQMILLGERLSAAECLRIGLVHKLASSSASLLEETLEWLAPIERGAPIAMAAALAAIDASTMPLEAGLDFELAQYELCLASEDRDEALIALSEKRPPVFKGR